MAENPNEINHIVNPEENIQNASEANSQNPQREVASLVGDEMLLGIYSEILDTIRQDRVEVSDILNNFCEMVMNEGDSSSASKEAIVNLVKAKQDSADKLTRVADLMTRLKLKDMNSQGSFITTAQGTVVNIGDSGMKKEMLKRLNSAKKKKD